MIRLIIPGEPMGKGRPRLGKFGAHTPVKTLNYENLVKEIFMINGLKLIPDKPQLKAVISCYYSIPESASKKKKELMKNKEIRPTKKPDCDNVAKIILDSLNKIAYADDSQIVELTVNKWYSQNPRVEVEIDKL
ncbi:RusA family crossover junction endodeoxyribonuclease [Clostridium swellfunianum]|uniref:RusA family crossover junction endodeoxyribonuclease n=1 Tax=Clostridium swellfunianum TaxID=1367462 RepID=UPI0020305446|nr:RusA family crossover junction endodeoxyribonuclease [Clostridium swellfunianum]MCM0648662.1 RusA family crossover junction endodeoxyribonuclease [Clostridium swellfunianum]